MYHKRENFRGVKIFGFRGHSDNLENISWPYSTKFLVLLHILNNVVIFDVPRNSCR